MLSCPSQKASLSKSSSKYSSSSSSSYCSSWARFNAEAAALGRVDRPNLHKQCLSSRAPPLHRVLYALSTRWAEAKQRGPSIGLCFGIHRQAGCLHWAATGAQSHQQGELCLRGMAQGYVNSSTADARGSPCQRILTGGLQSLLSGSPGCAAGPQLPDHGLAGLPLWVRMHALPGPFR